MRHNSGMKARRDAGAAKTRRLQRDSKNFNETALKKPAEGRQCSVMANDGFGGPYYLPFTVYRRGDEWFHSKTDRKIEVAIVMWRYT